MPGHCPYCGHLLRTQSRFCPGCGKPVTGRGAAENALRSGDYTVVRSISKGGMGAVYLARDENAFGRLCVVKQMLEYYDLQNPEERERAQERFEQEGRTLASLSHPGIPEIYSFFREDGRYYIVMEYIEGQDLEIFVTHRSEDGRLVHGQRLPQEQVLRYVVQVCDILEYLHSQQTPVLHQDIKPANLILEQHLGLIRLVDFGTARSHVHQESKDEEGETYGTDGYAPPEQYRGQPVPRSDVFALAATAYHLLTDDDPRDHPFKWPQLDTLPREIAEALRRALRTDPERRSTARELRQALETWTAPQRTLETFTFPGNNQIRSVSALPSLADDYWQAARRFLYQGDFQRWLRDINRHDLVTAADEIVQEEADQDRGLERFLRVVDPGLPDPKPESAEAVVDFGSVARHAAVRKLVVLRNATRGYLSATVSTTVGWLDVVPEEVQIWAGQPARVSAIVHASDLPLRAQQRASIIVTPEGLDPIEIPVRVRISIPRELWRLTVRAFRGAAPRSWHTMVRAWQLNVRILRWTNRVTRRFSWLPWLLWLAASVGIGALFYLPMPGLEGLPRIGPYLAQASLNTETALIALLAPPLLLLSLWLIWFTLSLLLPFLYGAIRGAWQAIH